MAEQITLMLQPREVMGKQVRRLRRQGLIPANIYGRGQPSRAVQIPEMELRRLLASHAGSRVIGLRLDGTEQAALVRHIEREPRSGRVRHVDFMHVELTDTIHAQVPLRLVGEAPAVRVQGGVLLHMLDTLEVECMSRDLPEALEFDITGLEELDSTLKVGDVPVPRGVKLLANPDEPVVKVAVPRAIVEEAPAAEEAAEAEAEAAETAGEEAPAAETEGGAPQASAEE